MGRVQANGLGRRGRGVVFATALAGLVVPSQADAAASEWGEGEQASARLISATSGTGDLEILRVGLQVQLEPGWKTYWRSPGDAGIPPHVEWEGSDNLDSVDFRYPAPRRFDYYGLDTFGYEDEIVYPIDIRVARVGQPVQLRAAVDLLICDGVCIPHSMDLTLDLPGGTAAPSEHALLLDQFRNRVPGDGARVGLSLEGATLAGTAEAPVVQVAFTATEPFVRPDLLIEGPEFVVFSRPVLELNDDGTRLVVSVTAEDAFGDVGPIDVTSEPLTVTIIDGGRAMEASISPRFGAPLLGAPTPGGASGASGAAAARAATGGVSLLAVLGLALVGGLILNLMPCVLPVLSIKLLSVISHGGDEPQRVRLGFLATTAGIVFSFLVIATGLVALKLGGSAVGWGIQFQQPIFIIGMVLIVTLFAANMWGLFEINLPGKASDVAVEHSGGTSMKGHFFSGAFATLLATPCSAPFLGTAVGFALSRGVVDIYAVFAALGIGMAIPFIIVAGFPKLAAKLPRPGAWMVTVKRVLSLVLVATALWLLTILAAQVSTTSALVVGALMVLAVLAIGLRGRLPQAARTVPVAVTAAAVLAFVSPAVLPGSAAAPQQAHEVAGVTWEPFDEAAIGRLVADGRVVFVDVTADWCITCKVNKARVLDVGEVAARLGAGEIIAMRADWTRPSNVISTYLASFGRFGIPFNVVYGPSTPNGVALPELLSNNAVLTALDGRWLNHQNKGAIQ